MAITTAVTRKFDNNYVQVEIESNRQEPRYYKVPENKADSFQKEYKKNSKKMPWIDTGLTLGAIIVMIVPTFFATKKIESKTARMFLGTLAGLVGGFGAMHLGTKIEENSHSKLLQKYGAEEIDYSVSSFPIG